MTDLFSGAKCEVPTNLPNDLGDGFTSGSGVVREHEPRCNKGASQCICAIQLSCLGESVPFRSRGLRQLHRPVLQSTQGTLALFVHGRSMTREGAQL